MKNETTSAKIPLLKADLPPFDTICERFRQVYESGWFSNFGKYVTQFEEEASAYLGTHAVTVSSGTQGLVFGLQALGLKPGQKVVLPSFSFMATAQAVIYAGGTPVFIDIESDLTLSPSKLEDLLSMHEDVGAVMPVHIFGLPCRVDEIAEVVKRFSHKRGEAPIPILYDAAHAFGSVYKGMRVGNFGNAEVFSLSTTKVLTTIEGGLISTSNAQVAEKIKKMRNYGMAPYSYNASSAGLNGKMSEF
ncbi:MAG: aminotransferase class I/II-fold pyridoxal phosphate-dependent enzyme, partial [Candidatus Omnitrophica bacterium]|nr:aminotransferase class I/II-fold pyridoxal phosphate-dependent enzyme [Candidatus Omnitrophota bacterium]